MKRSFRLALISFALIPVASIQAQSGTQNGATAGGLAGAVIGGIIGHQNDETTEGILIGGAVGAITGGLLGNAQDQQMAREHHYRRDLARQQQIIHAQNSQLQRQATRAVTISDVLSMSSSGVGDSVIINHIQTNGIERQLEVHEIISLSRQGVSEPVITAMQRAPLASTVVYRTPAPQPTVIIHEPQPTYYFHSHGYYARPLPPPHYYWR